MKIYEFFDRLGALFFNILLFFATFLSYFRNSFKMPKTHVQVQWNSSMTSTAMEQRNFTVKASPNSRYVFLIARIKESTFLSIGLEWSGHIFALLKTEKRKKIRLSKYSLLTICNVCSRVSNYLPLNRVQHFMRTMTRNLLKKTGRAYECCAIVSKWKIQWKWVVLVLDLSLCFTLQVSLGLCINFFSHI